MVMLIKATSIVAYAILAAACPEFEAVPLAWASLFLIWEEQIRGYWSVYSRRSRHSKQFEDARKRK